jgi:hypothetical protein
MGDFSNFLGHEIAVELTRATAVIVAGKAGFVPCDSPGQQGI